MHHSVLFCCILFSVFISESEPTTEKKKTQHKKHTQDTQTHKTKHITHSTEHSTIHNTQLRRNACCFECCFVCAFDCFQVCLLLRLFVCMLACVQDLFYRGTTLRVPRAETRLTVYRSSYIIPVRCSSARLFPPRFLVTIDVRRAVNRQPGFRSGDS